MTLRFPHFLCLLLTAWPHFCHAQAATESLSKSPSLLTARFTYKATLPAPEVPARETRLWIPLPSDDRWQTVRELSVDAPVPYQITREPKYGNRMLFLHVARLTMPFVVTVRYAVTRREVRVGDVHAPVTKSTMLTGKAATRDLQPDANVPIGGRYAELAREVVGDRTEPEDKLRALFAHVIASMQYDYKKESPRYAQGDVAFVCDYKKGNCSDLHSYLISLARSQQIPAVLEFGFPISGIPLTSPLPEEGSIGGYHCWAWFTLPGKDAIPLDASDARRWLDAGHPEMQTRLFGGLVLERSAVAVSRGRDLTLVPAQKAGSLNYFIYPYAEADGKTIVPQWEVRYQRLPAAQR